ncbi:MAG: hypothetical protein O2856_16335, partial [Planctomycetota bacterium]|nr:hypothetical protein [Planctomycetota bacterium]
GLAGPTSSLTVLSLKSKTPNTTVPSVPDLNQTAAVTQNLRPEFSWPRIPQADEYEIWVRSTTTGAVMVNSVATLTNSFAPTGDLGIGRFNIWVRATNEIGKSAWSKPLSFEINSPVTTIPTPDGMKRRPELTWHQMGGAAKYEIWLSDSQQPE